MRQALSDCEAYPCPSYASSTLGARCSSVCQLLRPCVHVTVCSLLFILSSALGQVEKGAQAQPLRQTSPGTSIRMSLLRGDTGSGSLTATSSVDARRQGASSSHVETRTVGQHACDRRSASKRSREQSAEDNLIDTGTKREFGRERNTRLCLSEKSRRGEAAAHASTNESALGKHAVVNHASTIQEILAEETQGEHGKLTRSWQGRAPKISTGRENKRSSSSDSDSYEKVREASVLASVHVA